MSIRNNPPPIDKISDRQGRLSEAFEIVRRCFRRIVDELEDLTSTPGGGGGGSGGGAVGATRMQHAWKFNGPFRADTAVDGGWVVPTALSITAVKLYREVPGTAGSTIVDLNVTPVNSTTATTLYSSQGNRPTIAYNDADLRIDCALPDTVTLAVDDVVTIDIDQKESGIPQNGMLVIEGS